MRTSEERKGAPVFSGVMNYFPDALMMIAELSMAGNEKHNPGEPLHWSKGKSGDHADCVARHLLEHGKIDEEDGFSHTVKVAWRALALLQTEIEDERDRNSRYPVDRRADDSEQSSALQTVRHRDLLG